MTNPPALEHGKYYHIYNRGNNRENIFCEERNYAYFLRLYAEHVTPITDTYAYCLMRNHFHLLVRIKEDQSPTDTGLKEPSRYFSNFFNAYARAFNRAYQRSGALFERPFGRVEVTSEDYLATLIVYIHRNPQKQGFVPDFRDWPHSSYHTLLATGATRLRRDEVLSYFGGFRQLVEGHYQDPSEASVLQFVPVEFNGDDT